MAQMQNATTATNNQPNPSAQPDAILISGNARFTVLTPALIRMEWSPTAQFEDRASFAFVNRNLAVPKFDTSHDNGWLVLKTDELTLRYREDSGAFDKDNLRITLTVGGKTVEWHPGMPAMGNLMGTTRTLDGVSGACRIDTGLLSRDGWTLVDDSDRLLFDSTPQRWATPRAEADALDWYFFGYGHEYQRQLGDFIKVAGRIPVPPKYAFGAWWSRYWAYTDDELKTLVNEFAEHDVPLDVLVIDIDWHLDGWTGYTWDPKCFPDPEGFLNWVHDRGLKTTLNLHPHDGVRPHEAMFPEFARAMGLDPEKTKHVPFDCADPRYMKAYFDILHHPKERQGVDFWWIDWQQGDETKIPGLDPLFWLNVLHWRDMEHNPDRGDKRPMIFSRWGGLGNHRYPIGFSGDTFCNWASLAFQPYFTTTAGNVGFGYWSHDIGGHQPGPVDPELYTRWIQFGVFSPILRTHTTTNPLAERRIWQFPTPYFEAMRDAFHLRYELLPYIYTMARKCYDTGIPLCRPLYYHWPELDEAYNHGGEYMFGDDLLVAPITALASEITGYANQKVWLPPGRWINWFTDDIHDGPCTVYVQCAVDEIPLFARAGAIIPTAKYAPRTHEMPDDLIVLHVFPGEQGEAELYEDDGMSEDYERTALVRTRITAEYKDEEYIVSVHPTAGELKTAVEARTYEIRYHAFFPAFAPSDFGTSINGVDAEEIRKPGSAGWRFDTDRMQFLVRTPSVDPQRPCTVALGLGYPYAENTWWGNGLSGRINAMTEVERMLELNPQSPQCGVEAVREDFSHPKSYEKAVLGSLLCWNSVLNAIAGANATDSTKRRAYARMLGLVPHMQVRPSDASGSELAGEFSALLSRSAQLDTMTWRAKLALSEPDNWELVNKTDATSMKAAIVEPVVQHFALRRRGPAQTTVLNGQMTIEFPDSEIAYFPVIDFPVSATLFPSINRWHLLGPFDAPMDDRLQEVFPPEQELDLAAKYAGQGGTVIRWQRVERPVTPNSDLTEEFFVEFHKYFDGIKYNAVAYALTYLHAPRDMDASLAFGSDDGIVIWHDDAEVYRHDVGRPYTPKEERIPIKLHKGSNKLLVKISQGSGMWGFGMHVETPDGKPLPEVKVLLTP